MGTKDKDKKNSYTLDSYNESNRGRRGEGTNTGGRGTKRYVVGLTRSLVWYGERTNFLELPKDKMKPILDVKSGNGYFSVHPRLGTMKREE